MVQVCGTMALKCMGLYHPLALYTTLSYPINMRALGVVTKPKTSRITYVAKWVPLCGVVPGAWSQLSDCCHGETDHSQSPSWYIDHVLWLPWCVSPICNSLILPLGWSWCGEYLSSPCPSHLWWGSSTFLDISYSSTGVLHTSPSLSYGILVKCNTYFEIHTCTYLSSCMCLSKISLSHFLTVFFLYPLWWRHKHHT